VTLRATGLLAGAALVLHQARYAIGYGGDSGHALAEQGHGYLGFASVVALLLLALAAAQLLHRVGRAWRTGRGEGSGLPLGLAWLLASLALTGIYTGQELAEGLLSSGHPAGLGALAAHGGLVAYPLALALGGLVALLLRGADAVVSATARRAGRRRPAPRRLPPPRRHFSVDLLRAPVLARGSAGRAPPALA
jgi:hypothetical protein